MPNILVVDDAQDVAGDTVPVEELEGPHHLLVGGLPALCHPIPVVELLGPVQAEPHGEAVLWSAAMVR